MLLLRAFSSGAVALSGVEAVSNGVPAFRKPESKNAAITHRDHGWECSESCFLGVSILASHIRPYRGELDATGLALMARHIYGGTGVLFWIMQISTFAILILAANTAYADFPRLASIIGKDGFIPRQFANRGDRLVYSNGIIFLSFVAALLIIAFDGNVTKLIPLYAFGVFTGFTLSQAGMVQHHRHLHEEGWRWKLAVNTVGAVTTGIIAAVVVISKFTQGAWIPAVVTPLMVLLFRVTKPGATPPWALRCELTESERPRQITNTMIVLVGGLHRGTVSGIEFASRCAPTTSSPCTSARPRPTARRWPNGGPNTRTTSSSTSWSTPTATCEARCTVSSPRSRSAGTTIASPSSSPSSSSTGGGNTCSTTRRPCS